MITSVPSNALFPCAPSSSPIPHHILFNLSITSLHPAVYPFHFLLSSLTRFFFFSCHSLLSPSSAVCPVGERWRRSVSEEVLLCERSCQDIYSPPINCSHSAEGCVCQEGLYRNTEGVCVIPALCPCHDQGMLWEVCIHTHTHTHTLANTQTRHLLPS